MLAEKCSRWSQTVMLQKLTLFFLTILLWRLLVVSDRQSLNAIPHTQLFSYLYSEMFTKEI